MIAEFERMAGDLEREIKIEQDRAGIHDPAHFAYPTYAKAAIQRRENLKRSADELRVQLDDAKAALGEAFEELKKVELLDERDQARERAEENAREQTELEFHRPDAHPQCWCGCRLRRHRFLPGLRLSGRSFPRKRESSQFALGPASAGTSVGISLGSRTHASELRRK